MRTEIAILVAESRRIARIRGHNKICKSFFPVAFTGIGVSERHPLKQWLKHWIDGGRKENRLR